MGIAVGTNISALVLFAMAALGGVVERQRGSRS
jgi:hypothetical protein